MSYSRRCYLSRSVKSRGKRGVQKRGSSPHFIATSAPPLSPPTLHHHPMSHHVCPRHPSPTPRASPAPTGPVPRPPRPTPVARIMRDRMRVGWSCIVSEPLRGKSAEHIHFESPGWCSRWLVLWPAGQSGGCVPTPTYLWSAGTAWIVRLAAAGGFLVWNCA